MKRRPSISVRLWLVKFARLYVFIGPTVCYLCESWVIKLLPPSTSSIVWLRGSWIELLLRVFVYKWTQLRKVLDLALKPLVGDIHLNVTGETSVRSVESVHIWANSDNNICGVLIPIDFGATTWDALMPNRSCKKNFNVTTILCVFKIFFITLLPRSV